MDIQEIIAFVILALAVAYPQKILLRRKAAGDCAQMMWLPLINLFSISNF
jgi:hypothetical protein